MNTNCIRVLLIEDDADDAFLLRKDLEASQTDGYSIKLEVVDNLAKGLVYLLRDTTDIVLLDLFLPDGEGLYSLKKIRETTPDVPVIIVTNLDDERPAIEAVGQGAQDYVVKSDLNGRTLIRAIRHAIERGHIRSALNKANVRLDQLSRIDPLTELLNRRGLQQELTAFLKKAAVCEFPLAVLLVDLDDFKPVNDMFGHAVGDVVLFELAQRLKSAVRPGDAVARVGGDEFMIILPNTTLMEATQLAEKVRYGISGTPVILASGKTVQITASIGLNVVPADMVSVDELMSMSYGALRRSKVTGKNRVTYDEKGFSANELLITDSLTIVERLRRTNAYTTVKQSIVRLTDSQVVGYEFLSRSNVEGFEMPDDFFRLSMEKNFLPWVDHTCFRSAVGSASEYARPALRCHFNLFPSTLIHLPIQQLIDELPACRTDKTYCIEISEQQIIGTPFHLLEQVRALKQAGVLVAIDDIGFGRSYLENWILLEPDIIKIDKSCVTGVGKDPTRLRSLKRILDVAKALNSDVIAEGIESKEDLNVLIDQGVVYGQGYLIDSPR